MTLKRDLSTEENRRLWAAIDAAAARAPIITRHDDDLLPRPDDSVPYQATTGGMYVPAVPLKSSEFRFIAPLRRLLRRLADLAGRAPFGEPDMYAGLDRARRSKEKRPR